MISRSRSLDDNPYGDPKDPRYIPSYVWDQLDMEGRLWVVSRQDINEMDVFHLRNRLDYVTGTVARLWVALLCCVILASIALTVLSHLR